MASLAEYEAAVAASSPTAWWKLDDASGPPVDSSGNGFDMASENITEFQADGPLPGWEGKAIRCDGGAGCTRANVGTATDDFTFECWIQIVAISANGQYFVSNQTLGTQGWGTFFGATGFFAAISQGVATEAVSAAALATNDTLWYHMVIQRRSGVWKYFLNGVPDTANAGSDTPNGSPTAFTLLSSSNLHTRMSQAAYYETALSDAEIFAHYAAATVASPSEAHWKTGMITVPGSTGDVVVTGLGGTPKAVFFFGTNWLTEDAAVTDAGTGVFRGMAAPQYNSPSTIVNCSSCVLPSTTAFLTSQFYCIQIISTAGVVVDDSSFAYTGAVTSFDADGFTVNFPIVNSSGYNIAYVALMDVANAAGFMGTTNQTALAFGFKAGGALLHGNWGGPNNGAASSAQAFYGSASYPGAADADWVASGLSLFTFGASIGQQFSLALDANVPGTVVVEGGHFVGPFLVGSAITAVPNGLGLTDLSFGGDPGDGGMIVAWDDDKGARSLQTPPDNQDDTVTVSGLTFAPGILMSYSLSDEPQGQGSGATPGAAGFSVVTNDFQWCALVDGESSRGSYQSFQRGFVDNVSGTDVHSGNIRLTGDGFVMTTVEDDLPPASWLWHVFGHPESASWIPHIYRRESG